VVPVTGEITGRTKSVALTAKAMLAAAVVLSAIATKTLPPRATETQVDEDGKVLAVQVIPSGEVAAVVDGPAATAKKELLP